jgi:hypothetical protein
VSDETLRFQHDSGVAKHYTEEPQETEQKSDEPQETEWTPQTTESLYDATLAGLLWRRLRDRLVRVKPPHQERSPRDDGRDLEKQERGINPDPHISWRVKDKVTACPFPSLFCPRGKQKTK